MKVGQANGWPRQPRGLSLPLTRRLAELHGGSLDVAQRERARHDRDPAGVESRDRLHRRDRHGSCDGTRGLATEDGTSDTVAKRQAKEAALSLRKTVNAGRLRAADNWKPLRRQTVASGVQHCRTRARLTVTPAWCLLRSGRPTSGPNRRSPDGSLNPLRPTTGSTAPSGDRNRPAC